MNTTNEAVFDSEKDLKSFVDANRSKLFGDEIEWLRDRNLPGESQGKVKPDLLGKCKAGNYIYTIVEIKFVSDGIERSDDNSYRLSRLVVGQSLHYLCALMKKVLPEMEFTENVFANMSALVKLFIVTDIHAQPLENMCNLLKANGFQIEYINASSHLEV